MMQRHTITRALNGANKEEIDMTNSQQNLHNLLNVTCGAEFAAMNLRDKYEFLHKKTQQGLSDFRFNSFPMLKREEGRGKKRILEMYSFYMVEFFDKTMFSGLDRLEEFLEEHSEELTRIMGYDPVPEVKELRVDAYNLRDKMTELVCEMI
jgi:hypothetical protein